MPRGVKVQSDLKGVEAAVNVLHNTEEMAIRWLKHATHRLANTIFERSQVLVPVSDEGSYGQAPGYLKESGDVKVVQDAGETFEIIVGYGLKHRVFYAVYVHERAASHKFPTQWKYVERAVQQGLAIEAGLRNRKNVITDAHTSVFSTTVSAPPVKLRGFNS